MASAPDDDPLLFWLRSIRQVKQAHPEDKSKILPYVSDCYKEFQALERYRNDPRFLRICVQLADCSPEPLKIMADLDERGIGHDHALFYEAYATCLEAKRRFGDANNVYKRGLARLPQPAEKLINSYKLFRDRMDTRKRKRQDQLDQHGKKICNIPEEGLHGNKHGVDTGNGIRHMEACQGGAELPSKSHLLSKNWYTAEGLDISFEELRLANAGQKASTTGEECAVMEVNYVPLSKHSTSQSVSFLGRIGTGSFGEETIQIRNFAAEAITGKEKDVEDARHHGLVDPTINTKEALQDILSMFSKPLHIDKKKGIGKSSRRQGFVSAVSSPLLQDNKRQLTSPRSGLQAQPLEFCVFKDDEQEHLEAKTQGKPAAVSPLLHQRNRLKKSSLNGLQGQPLEICVFRDDEQGQSQVESRSKPAALSPLVHTRKGQINSPLGSLQTRPSEFCVFKDDEPDQAQVEFPTRKAENSSFSVHSDKKLGSDLQWAAKSERRAEECGFFVFKDEEVLEGESEQALSVYRDKAKSLGKAQCSMSVEIEQTDSDPLVSRAEPRRGSLQEIKAGLFCHDLEGKTSKGKGLGVNKTLACGIENLLPQSPLYQP